MSPPVRALQADPAGRSFDVVIVGLGRVGRMGGQAADRGRAAGGRTRGRTSAHRRGLQGARARLPVEVPRPYEAPARARCSRVSQPRMPYASGTPTGSSTTSKSRISTTPIPISSGFERVVVGGRTNIWGRQCLRLSDIDFKAASHDGVGVDWPIGYEDIAPYYDLVEDYVGVSAMPEGLAAAPGRPVPATDGPHLQRDGGSHAPQVEVRPHDDTGAHRQPDASDPRAAAVPLLRAMRARMRHALLLQRLVHDDGRCRSRPAAARSSRVPWPTRCSSIRRSHRARGILYIDRATRQPQGDLRARRRPLRADDGVGADPVQLGDASGSRRASRTRADCWAST